MNQSIENKVFLERLTAVKKEADGENVKRKCHLNHGLWVWKLKMFLLEKCNNGMWCYPSKDGNLVVNRRLWLHSSEFILEYNLVIKNATIDNCQALCPFLCFCVSKSLRKWTQTDTKVTFHPPTPTEIFFCLKWKVWPK